MTRTIAEFHGVDLLIYSNSNEGNTRLIAEEIRYI